MKIGIILEAGSTVKKPFWSVPKEPGHGLLEQCDRGEDRVAFSLATRLRCLHRFTLHSKSTQR